MFELGAASVSLADAGDEPIYEPLPGHTPVWQNSIVTGMFASDNPDNTYHQLALALPVHLVDDIRQQHLQEQDWEQAYKQHFQPVRCADKLWIVPSWCDAPDPDAVNIDLDPGMAFGTGSHPTTALCLAWLGGNDLRDIQVIDYGCGSGILAIAACKLGAKQVIAIDIDPQALRATEANAATNNLSAADIIIALPAAMDRSPVDLLMANILSGPLVEFAASFAAMVKPSGRILLSGILKSQLNDIQSAYLPYFELDQAVERGDWIAISGIRSGDG